jgi:soluble lytic murein transglycosylase-like protein
MTKLDVSLATMIRKGARAHGFDPSLIAAISEQESGFQPWAMRFEPRYRWLWPRRNAVKPPRGVSLDTEVNQQKTSWGLMQVMGAVARERGYVHPFLSGLCLPALGIEYGCLQLAHMRGRFPELRDFVSAYNAGRPVADNPYADEVLERVERFAWLDAE